jgi:glycoside hydrolase-like protein
MRKLALVLSLLAVAGCAGPPPPVAVPPPRVGPVQGIDLAIDARDVSSELRSRKLDFVARYYRDPTSRWPTLSASEAAMLSAAGMNIVAVWEYHSARPDYFSYQSGYADALNAYRQARAVGQPAGSAIYFAVDYNAPDADIRGSIDRYFRGVHAGLASLGGNPYYRVGVYGSGAVCGYLKRARLAQYAWLSNSTAWSGYGGFTDWNIKQGRGTLSLSFSHDWNQAREDYGGFQVKNQYSSL